jgi:chromosomal replication initiation ATPase DnaA
MDDPVLDILNAVSDEMQIPLDLILGKSKRAKVVEARWIAMYLLHTALGMNSSRLSELFNVYKSTALEGYKRVDLDYNLKQQALNVAKRF